MVGQTVSHYRVLDQVGVGGMGVVYKAEDARLGRLVALKFLPAELAADAATLERFDREARAASSLNHPHICTIYEIGDHDGRPFIAMELLDGETLRHRLDGRPHFSPDRRRPRAADGRSARGRPRQGHRPSRRQASERVRDRRRMDQAPRLRTGEGGVVVPRWFGRDDGVRRAAARSHRSRVAIGTLAYMSPEQTRGDELDARTDIFSLGAVLYEMATGRQAFADRQPLPSGRTTQKLLPALERIIAKALEADREVRYQSMADLRADLKRLQRDLESGSAALETTASTRHARPRKGIASLAVLPLVNTSGDPDADYLSEGIAESLINSFAELPKLRVAQRVKSFHYTGPNVDVSAAARELGVQAILSGRIVKRSDTRS